MKFSGLYTIGASLALALAILAGCKEKEMAIAGPCPSCNSIDLTDIPYEPKSYTIKKPDFFPPVPIPADNPMTYDGVQLGRRLFYDPILSADSTQSCSSCHLPAGSFTDNKPVSLGVDKIHGRRSAMSLLNVGYINTGLFWDGRSASLEDQALRPVEDPIEMHNTWTAVVCSLQCHPTYPTLFRKAFGIQTNDEITKELAAKAIAQFERIMISSGKSKYDLYLKDPVANPLESDEALGRIMFFDEAASLQVSLPDAECFHCHGSITLNGNNFFNNGIDSAATYSDFKDKGRGEVTENETDYGKFRAPTLRNIAMSAPYMHDGRFQTLEEVINHYQKGGKHSPGNKDQFIHVLGFKDASTVPPTYFGWDPEFSDALVKFLHTLTDTAFINNPDLKSPF